MRFQVAGDMDFVGKNFILQERTLFFVYMSGKMLAGNHWLGAWDVTLADRP